MRRGTRSSRTLSPRDTVAGNRGGGQQESLLPKQARQESNLQPRGVKRNRRRVQPNKSRHLQRGKTSDSDEIRGKLDSKSVTKPSPPPHSSE
jgi:hypothetical protein